jgi:hypothetical protein
MLLQNAPMNWRILLPLTLAIAGCSTLPTDVVHLRDGTLRASASVEAANYCRSLNKSTVWLGKAPAETGVFFRCE